jgi:hypothetical protein
MKAALFAVSLCFCFLPAFADKGGGGDDGGSHGHHHGAPAPVIGAGIPALVAVGGILLGRRLLRRKQR